MDKKYIDAEKLKRLVGELKERAKRNRCDSWGIVPDALEEVEGFITSLQQEKPEENKLPNKRTRVNYAICKLQSFKPLREAIVLDGYVYDEGKCYRENLLNYIHAIPERRLMEIRSYLKEKGWWPYDDDADWVEQEQPEVDFEEEWDKFEDWMESYNRGDYPTCYSPKQIARHFYELGLNARKK